MKWGFVIAAVFCVSVTVSAQRYIPIASQFKDEVLSPASGNLTEPSFFPFVPQSGVSQRFFTPRDWEPKRYSNFGHYLYQRELIELKDSAVGKVWITPLFDFSAGLQLQDSNPKRYQNTRGIRAEGFIGQRVFFTTSFYENQAIFADYFADYIRQRGEQYRSFVDSNYYTSNAVVPGAGRTKPFKTDGFDYAYATGMIAATLIKNRWTVMWGNQPFFIGSGHRSLLWSDNSTGLMNLRSVFQLSPKWHWQFVRARGLNLLRRPQAQNGEAYYEPTSLSVATLYFQTNDKLTIGLFEGGKWYRGDSVSQEPIQPLYFLPVPGAALVQNAIKEKSVYSLTGLDFRIKLGKNKINSDAVVSIAPTFKTVVYGQFALNPAEKSSMVYQLGIRTYPKRLSSFSFQLEYNHADDRAYQSSISRLNYSNYNLPIAHPSATAFDELLLRINWQKKYWFVRSHTNAFLRQAENETLLMPVLKSDLTSSRQVINQLVEMGYQFNRTYGLEAFSSFRYRYAKGDNTYNEGAWLMIGIRTAINNHYSDF